MTSPPADSNTPNPFPLREDGIGHYRIRQDDPEFVRHEVMFEDAFDQLGERRVFVGTGIGMSRLYVALIITFTVLTGLMLRAGWMQFAEGSSFQSQADANRYRSEVLPSRRGIIRDRNGVVLAENIPTFHVRMRWSDLPLSADARQETISYVARTVGVTSDDILTSLTATGTHPDEWIDVARDISYDRALALEVKMPELSGVALITAAKRQYPLSAATPSLSHVLGYVGLLSPAEYADLQSSGYRHNDEIGKTGVEASYETSLRGIAGERRVEVDAVGRPRAVVSNNPPTDGRDVTLTIDATLQAAAEKALQKQFERTHVSRGSAILMNAQTGGIIALVSWPAYDDNAFAGRVSSTVYSALLKNEDRPLFPRAWAGQFPSGSTIKPLIATAALAEGVITPNTTVNSVGGIKVGPWFFPDWSAGGHGITNVRKAIAWSVNTFFYYVGGGYNNFIGLGVDRLTSWMKKFGMGSETGIDLPGETAGNVPSQDWKQQTKGERWYIGDTYNLSIGQGDLLVTPLQMARMTATVANGGKLVVPHVVESSTSSNIGVSPMQGASLDQVSADDWKTVQLGMRDTVTYGSGRALNSLPVQSAGKTGTAQWNSNKPNHAWYIGFAPFKDPEVVVTVLLEEGGEGSSYAVPVAGDILRAWYAEKMHATSTAAVVK
jgi:penicillin-binding protein 2